MRGAAAVMVVLVGCSGAEPVDDLVLERNAGSCKIDQVTYAAGAVNPANPCQVCDPSISKKVWSTAPDGSSCSDGNECTAFDSCSAGTCSGPPLTCNDSDECTADSCVPSSGCRYEVDQACLLAADLVVGPIESTPLAPVAGATAEVVVPFGNIGAFDAEGVELYLNFVEGVSIDPASVHFETPGWSAGALQTVVVPNGEFLITVVWFDQVVVSSNPPGVIPTGATGRLRFNVHVDSDLAPGTSRGMAAHAATTSRERITDNNADFRTLTSAPL